MTGLSFRFRLILVLITFITLFSSFGAYTIIKVRQLERVTNYIYDDPVKVSSAAIEARVDTIKLQSKMKEILLLTDKNEILSSEQELVVLENRILKNLEDIRNQSIYKESLELEQKIRENLTKWRKNQEQILHDMLYVDKDSAIFFSQYADSALVDSIERDLKRIDYNAKFRASQLVMQANEIQNELERLLILINLGIGILFTILFTLVIRSILSSIHKLQQSMNESAETGVLKDAVLEGDNEIVGIAKHYNMLIQKLRNQFWLKDGQNSLSHEISSAASLKDMTQKSLGFLVKALGIGKGALYLYNETNKHLELSTSYAFTEKEQKYGSYALGEGIIGQVGLDKSVIYLENVRNYEDYISTGILLEAPINLYIFPLVSDDKLLGVIELASFEPFDELKCEFLKGVARIIAANLYTLDQNQKVKRLLEISEKSQVEARYNASQLLSANQVLEDQQRLLQQRSEELLLTNTELEEKQQLLQQQSEELQQSNVQLEEHQLLLEEQTKLLNIRNQQLENSRVELLKHSKDMEAANKYKSQFLANMSHELRTPLNSIILLSRLLIKNEGGSISQKQLEKLGIIYSSGQELLRLIDDILDLSKIEAGKMSLCLEEFYTEDLLNEIKALFDSVAHEKLIEFACIDHAHKKLYGDYKKIAQIIRNLVSNAIKFTAKGSVSFEIRAEENGDTKFIVTDTGIGISKENLNRIFEEFQQGDGSISRNYGGTGLGLSISKKLAALMNGRIMLESEEGKGSCFTLLLKEPSMEASDEYIAKDKAYEMPVEFAWEESALAEAREGTILLIGEDEAFAAYIQSISKSMGFGTIIGRTGKEGLELAKSNTVDAILMELALPDMSGIEVLRELKSLPELRRIPIHAVSSKYKEGAITDNKNSDMDHEFMEDEDITQIIASMISFRGKELKQLLVVEDNEVQRNAMQFLLESDGIEVVTVNSEEEAVLKLGQGDFDAVILDLELTSGSGMTVCRYIQRRGLHIPTIVYTGKDLTAEQEKEIRRYADSIVIKTANSDHRLLDEVTLFLHKIKKKETKSRYLRSRTNKKYAMTLKGKKILIADDDPKNVFVLASALEDFGAEILEAENGKAALEQMEQQHVDLILMDVMMPVMDGYQAIKAIRSKEQYKKLPIIAVTAKSLKDDRDKCIAAGANDYISKPVDYDILVRLVKAWISK